MDQFMHILKPNCPKIMESILEMSFPDVLIFWNTMKMEWRTYCACQETFLFETTPRTFGNLHWDCNQHEGHVLGGPSLTCTPINGQQTSVVYHRFIWNHFDTYCCKIHTATTSQVCPRWANNIETTINELQPLCLEFFRNNTRPNVQVFFPQLLHSAKPF